MKNMIVLCDSISCTGCGACVNRCPISCIRMVPDAEGFLRPEIDQVRCIGCGQCHKVCPVLESPAKHSKPEMCYAAWARDNRIRQKSSSGGIFSVLAEEILRRGGHVAGAAFDENMELRHILITEPEQLVKLQGSKYIQSNPDMIYREVEMRLKQNIPVLFTGTPCQVAALLTFLGREYAGLYTCELICHGVPSPGFFRRYLQRVEDCDLNTIRDFQFRDLNGWGYRLCMISETGYEKPLKGKRNDFLSLFLGGVTMREACYRCSYASPERVADITLGDFWGIQYSHKPEHFTRGISFVALNSFQGQELFHTINDQIVCERRTFEEAANHNQQLIKPTRRPAARNQFYGDYCRLPYREFRKKYGLYRPLYQRICSAVKRRIILLKCWLRSDQQNI